MVHGVAQVFSSMRRHEDDSLVFFNGFDFRIFEMVILLDGCKERVDDGIACYENGIIALVFTEKVLTGCFCRCEVHISKNACQLAVRFFRERGKKISRAQACFDVSDADLLVESGKSGREGRRRVAVDKDVIRFFLLQYIFQAAEDAGGDVIERLSALHDVEIIVDRQSEEVDDLIEHFPVLGGQADLGINFFMLQQFPDKGRHLDGFRSGAEYRHYL